MLVVYHLILAELPEPSRGVDGLSLERKRLLEEPEFHEVPVNVLEQLQQGVLLHALLYSEYLLLGQTDLVIEPLLHLLEEGLGLLLLEPLQLVPLLLGLPQLLLQVVQLRVAHLDDLLLAVASLLQGVVPLGHVMGLDLPPLPVPLLLLQGLPLTLQLLYFALGNPPETFSLRSPAVQLLEDLELLTLSPLEDVQRMGSLLFEHNGLGGEQRFHLRGWGLEGGESVLFGALVLQLLGPEVVQHLLVVVLDILACLLQTHLYLSLDPVPCLPLSLSLPLLVLVYVLYPSVDTLGVAELAFEQNALLLVHFLGVVDWHDVLSVHHTGPTTPHAQLGRVVLPEGQVVLFDLE